MQESTKRHNMRALNSGSARLKVIKRSVEAGASIKKALGSEQLPATHSAYVAKNAS